MIRHSIVVSLVLWLVINSSVFAAECNEHRGAGVLPYAVNSVGQYMVLLGYQAGRGWSGFGGGPKVVSTTGVNSKRCEYREETALRETVEETRHFLSRSELVSRMPGAPRHPMIPKQREFQTFFVKVKYAPVAPYYSTAVLEGKKFGYQEISDIAWAPLDALVAHVMEEGAVLQMPNDKGLWRRFKRSTANALKEQGRLNLFP